VRRQGLELQQRWHRIRQGAALCIIAVALLLMWLTPLGEQLRLLIVAPNPERLQHWLSPHVTWVACVLIGLMILHTLVPVPAELLALVAGRMLGPFWGFLTIWTGAMLGAALGFFLARVYGQALIQRLIAQPRLGRVRGWLQRDDLFLLLALRLVPILSFNLINYALGLTVVSWRRFMWTTAVGIVPMTLLMVVAGTQLHDWRLLLLLTLVAVLICLGGYRILRSHSTVSPVCSHSASRLRPQVADTNDADPG
jgi:uncharacterized membrane protein YdjX (TVP38/TMEM64 family)